MPETNFTQLAADNASLNVTMAQARQFQAIAQQIGLTNPRIFVQPRPGQRGGVFLIPEVAQKGDQTKWPDRNDVDTSGADMSQFGDPGNNPMFLSLSVDESPDFYTIAPTLANLTDPSKQNQRVSYLTAFLHEVQQGGGRDLSGLIGNLASPMDRVKSILG